MRIFEFQNLFLGTAQKKYVKNAQRELLGIDSNIKIIDRYPDGIFTFKTAIDNNSLISALKKSPPVFLRHISPLNYVFFIPRDTDVPTAIAGTISGLAGIIKPGKKTAVQVRRVPGDYEYTLYSIKKAVDPIITEKFSAEPAVKRPQQVISIFIADSTEINIKQSITCQDENLPCELDQPVSAVCFIGVSAAEDNLCEWSGGEVRFANEPNQKSRAEHKLLEAFEVFQIKPVRDGNALDLGASPGGWTRILRQKGYYVTAVDRAPLDPDMMNAGGVSFIKQDALHFKGAPDKYDIITSDINRDPVQSAKALILVANSVKKGAVFVLTIKLTGDGPEKTIEKVLETLKSGYRIKGVRQLYNNRDEVTVWGNRE